ncbi:MAG: amidase family protein, partial [Acidimicrobiia bacterium]
MSDLADLTVSEAAAGLRSGELTSVELLEAVNTRAAITEANLHAYLNVDREGSARAAVAADAAFKSAQDLGPLQGIPVALKDNMVTRGLETTCSSKILSGYLPPYDGTAVSRLRHG